MKTSHVVWDVLEKDPRTRDDDTRLLVAVYLTFGVKMYAENGVTLADLPKPSTILKARARIQNEDGQHLAPSEAVRARRKEQGHHGID